MDEPEPGGRFAEFWSAFQQLHPAWECITWAKSSDVRALVKDPGNRERFDWAMEHSPYGEAPDIGRYAILAEYGGVYWDADMEPLRPLDELLADPRPFVAWENGATCCTAVLGSPPQHPAILDVIAALPANARRLKGRPPNHTTGPELLTGIWRERDDVRRLPPMTFYPVGWWERDQLGGPYPEGTYAVHHWAKGWDTTPTVETAPGPRQAVKTRRQMARTGR